MPNWIFILFERSGAEKTNDDSFHKTSKPESILDTRQKSSLCKKTADVEVLADTQWASSRLTKQPGNRSSAGTTAPQKIAAASRAIPVLGVNRIEAATYIGVSASKFDQMVKDGRMPPPKLIDTRRVWDIRQLNSAFDRLPGGDDDDQNEWDEVLH